MSDSTGTFLHFIAEEEDFIPSSAAAGVTVHSADFQLGCVRGSWKTKKKKLKIISSETKIQ